MPLRFLAVLILFAVCTPAEGAAAEENCGDTACEALDKAVKQ